MFFFFGSGESAGCVSISWLLAAADSEQGGQRLMDGAVLQSCLPGLRTVGLEEAQRGAQKLTGMVGWADSATAGSAAALEWLRSLPYSDFIQAVSGFTYARSGTTTI
jgi:carboxylesterase type B